MKNIMRKLICSAVAASYCLGAAHAYAGWFDKAPSKEDLALEYKAFVTLAVSEFDQCDTENKLTNNQAISPVISEMSSIERYTIQRSISVDEKKQFLTYQRDTEDCVVALNDRFAAAGYSINSPLDIASLHVERERMAVDLMMGKVTIGEYLFNYDSHTRQHSEGINVAWVQFLEDQITEDRKKQKRLAEAMKELGKAMQNTGGSPRASCTTTYVGSTARTTCW